MRPTQILLAAVIVSIIGYANAQQSSNGPLTSSSVTTALGFTPQSNALASGHVYVGNGSNVATDTALSQDCTITNAGVVTCLKTNNVLLGTAATANAGTNQPGLITTIVNTKSVFAKFSKASTVDNLEGSSQSFTCTGNPVVTMYECGTSSTCAAPTTIGTVTVTAAGAVADGTVSAPAITAGDYVAFAISAGTCTALDVSAVAQVHAN